MATGEGKPRLLLLTRNLPPLIGGMERLIWHMADELKASFDLRIIGPKGASELSPSGVPVSEVPVKPLWLFLLRMFISVLLTTLRLRPRVVFAGSGLTAPFAWIGARMVGAKSITYLHGLDIDTQDKMYRLLWLPFIRHCDYVLANSHHTRQLAIKAGVQEHKIVILHPGVELPDLSDAEPARERFRERYGLEDSPVLLYIGRITERKGLLPFIDTIFPEVKNQIPHARLVVIGDEPKLALLQGHSLLDRIQASLESKGNTKDVLLLGSRTYDDPEISEAYFAADVHIFPVQDRPGDNEGFGMVAIEAAAHGLPTIAFSAGGVPDAVRDGSSGKVVSAGDNDNFSRSLIRLLSTLGERPDIDCRKFSEGFSWPEFGRKLREICAQT